MELEYYKHEEYEILIPRIFGAEVKKDIAVSSGTRKKWDEAMLFEDAKKNLTGEEFAAFEKIYVFSKKNTDRINLGTGSYGTFSPVFSSLSVKSLFTLGTDKRLSFNFKWIAGDNEKTAETFKSKLEAIGFRFPENYKEIRPSAMPEEWLLRTDKFLSILIEMITKTGE